MSFGLDRKSRLRRPDISNGVGWLVVFAYLVMNVRAGRTPCAARVADLIATFDPLSGFNSDPRQVAVARRDSVAVVKDDEIAVT